MQMYNNVVPANMLYDAADYMGDPVTPLPFFKCTLVSIIKIMACLLEFRWY